jgi:hypothetical protein
VSLPTALLLLALSCWCLWLLRAALALLESGVAQRELQGLGVAWPPAVPLWCWLRFATSLAAAMGALLLLQALGLPSPWLYLPLCSLAAWGGWRLPSLVLAQLARRRERRLSREVVALVDRITVALLCSIDPVPAMHLALAHGSDQELRRLLPPLAAGGAALHASRRAARARKPVGPSARSAIVATAELAMLYACAPPAVRGLARVLRRASGQPDATAEVERLKRTLLAWSRGYASGAYDGSLTPPEPKDQQLEVQSTIELNSS